MQVRSIINEVYDGRPSIRLLDYLEGIMVHRVGVNARDHVVIGYDGRSICDAFIGRTPKWIEVAEVTGRENPYTFLIGGNAGPDEFDGVIWQALPLNEIGHHARRFSGPYLGVACIGDFRKHVGTEPSPRQWAALVTLLADLSTELGLTTASIKGHGEVFGAHGGSKAPGRINACPGDLLHMANLRASVDGERRLANLAGARERLVKAGVVLP